jgi:transposase
MENDSDLHEEIHNLKLVIEQKNQRILALEELLANLTKRHFGTSSEKSGPQQIELFNEAEMLADQAEAAELIEATTTIAEHERRKKKRISIPEELERIEIIHDLPEAEKICPHDQTELKRIGSETHEQLDIVPAQVRVLKHIRYKYACPCCEQHLATARKPKQPIEKSIASPGLLASIAIQKFVDGLPLYRQLAIFKRIGVALDDASLANWMIKCGRLVQSLINLIHEHILNQPVVHMDETPIQVLQEPDKPPQSKSYMWVLLCSTEKPAVLFHYSPTRSGDVAKTLLRNYSGHLMADAYGGYNSVCEENKIIRGGCLVHARRKFTEAKAVQPKGKTGKADEALSLIGKLYRIEAIAKDWNDDARLQIRQKESKPIIGKLKIWLDKSLSGILPESAIGKALRYLHNQWASFIVFLQDGRYPIDNNPAENAIRPFVIGRKNWLFATSQRGASASANLYSLVESAKLNGVEPYAYLHRVFTGLPNATCLEDIEKLLPWNVKSAVH